MKLVKPYEYDLAFSFAGENRDYVNPVASYLKRSGIEVFYDDFKQVELWGKDLYTYLDEVYRTKARFCIMFISKHYQRKIWTNHERKSAQARAFQENEDYIWPARFDNTEIPGVRPDVGYISLGDYTPQQFAQLIIEKLKLARLALPKHIKASSGASRSKPSKAIGRRGKSNEPNPSKLSRASANSKHLKFRTKTVNLSLQGIDQVPENKSVVYKILTEGARNNYTGVASRGKIKATLQKHLQKGKSYVPGSKIHIEQMTSIKEAKQKADRIVKKSTPKYNASVK